MNHYIIVKYKESVSDKQKLLDEITKLFSRAGSIEGIFRISVKPAVITAKNRHDLMIQMEMDQEALAVFDSSEIHKEWKERFGDYISQKTIFDCD